MQRYEMLGMIDQRQPVELGESRPQFGETVQARFNVAARVGMRVVLMTTVDFPLGFGGSSYPGRATLLYRVKRGASFEMVKDLERIASSPFLFPNVSWRLTGTDPGLAWQRHRPVARSDPR